MTTTTTTITAAPERLSFGEAFAGVALFRFKGGVIPVVVASGLAGLALTFLRPFLT